MKKQHKLLFQSPLALALVVTGLAVAVSGVRPAVAEEAVDEAALSAPVLELRLTRSLSEDRVGTGAPAELQLEPATGAATDSPLPLPFLLYVLAALAAGLGLGWMLSRLRAVANAELTQAHSTIAKLRETLSDSVGSGSDRLPPVADHARDAWQSTVSTLEQELRERTSKLDALADELTRSQQQAKAARTAGEALSERLAITETGLAERNATIEAMHEDLAASGNREQAADAALRAQGELGAQRLRALDEEMEHARAALEQATAAATGLEDRVATLTAELAGRESALEQLRLELGQAEQAAQQRAADQSGAQNAQRIATLEQELATACTAREESLAAASRLEDKAASLSAALAERESALERLQAEFDEAQQAARGAAQQAAERSGAQVEEWNSTVSTLKADLDRRTRLLDEKSDSLELSRSTAEEALAEAAAAATAVAASQELLRERDATIAALEAKLEVDAGQREERQAKIGQLQEEIAAERLSAQETSDKASELHRRLIAEQKAAQGLNERLAQSDASVSSLTRQLEEAQSEAAELSSRSTDLAGELEQARERNDSLEELRAQQDDLLRAQREELGAARELADQLVESHDALEKTRQSLALVEAKAAEAADRLSGSQAERAALQRQLDDLQESSAGKDQALTEGQEQLDSAVTELAERKRQLEDLRTQLTRAEAAAGDAAVAQEQIEEHEKLLASLKEQLSNSQERAVAAEAASQQSSAELAALRNTVETTGFQLTARLEEAASVNAALEQGSTEAAAQAAQLQQQLDEARGSAETRLAAQAKQHAEELAALNQAADDRSAEISRLAGQVEEWRDKCEAMQSGSELSGGVETADVQAQLEHNELLQAQLAEARTAADTLREAAASHEAQLNKNTLLLKQAEARLSEVTTERNAQIHTIRTLRSRNGELEETSKALQADLASKPVGDFQRAALAASTGDEDPGERLAQIEPLFEELSSANRMLVTKQVAMQATISNHSGELKKRAVLIDRLKKKLIEARKKEKAGTSGGESTSQAKKELLEYRNRVRELEAKLSDHGVRYRNLEQARDQWQQHAATLKRTVEERELQRSAAGATDKEVQRLEEELVHRDRQLAEVEDTLRSRGESVESLRKDLKAWMSRVTPLVAALKERDQRIAALEAGQDVGVQPAPPKTEVAGEDLHKRDAEMVELQSRLGEQAGVIATLRGEVERLEQSGDSPESGERELERLRTELKARGDIITELENNARQFDDFRQQLEQRDERIRALENAGGPVSAGKGDATLRIHHLEQSIESTKVELQQSRKRVSDLEEILRDREETVDIAAATGEQVALGELVVLRDEVAAQTVLIDNLEADLVFWKRRAQSLENNEA